MAMIYKLLLRQIYFTYRRQGFAALGELFIKTSVHILNRSLGRSNSQKGEDLLIDEYFNHKKRGFYIDIGACHPKRFNNTKIFYDKGWRGINIEPNPTRIEFFHKERKRDINLNIGIGKTKKMATFYLLNSAGTSTFSKKEANSLIKLGHKLERKIKVQMYRLEDIIKKHVKGDIDFMTVDTEALDLEVLKSNNWKKVRPKLICVETIDFINILTSIKENTRGKDEITNFLRSKGYEEFFSNGLNTFYQDIEFS